MTEQEWLACHDPEPMIEFLERQVSERKIRLVAVACCHRIWHLLPDCRSRKAVEVAERFADSLAKQEELLAAEEPAKTYAYSLLDTILRSELTDGCRERASSLAALAAAHCSSNSIFELRSVAVLASGAMADHVKHLGAGKTPQGHVVFPISEDRDEEAERRVQCGLLREIAGAFQPIFRGSSRLTSTSLAIAQSIYDEKAFDRLPILADALEEAGITHPDLLNHCRQPGEHVRGCWALDLVLGKS